MIHFRYVQTVLPENVIQELKIRTKKPAVKDALAEAAYHYLECNIDKK